MQIYYKQDMTKDFISEVKLVHGDKYNYSKTKFINNKTKVEIICSQHGSFFQLPFDHKYGRGCRLCGYKIRDKKQSLTTPEFIANSIKVFGDLYDYTEVEYINAYTPVKIKCKKHGSFWQVPHDHTSCKAGCSECRKEKLSKDRTYTKEEYIDKSKLVHGNKYKYSQVKYKDSYTKTEIVCPEHGSFWQAPYSHLAEHGCPSCSHHISKPQQKLYNYLKRKLPKEEILLSDRIILRPRELDIYIPKYKLAIEVDGLYWHSEQFGFTKFVHQEKVLECQEKSVILLRFWDYEILEKFSIISSIIRSKLGFNKRIYARKCEVRKLEDKKEVCKFLNMYHLQGALKFEIGYGLYVNNELVQLMTFGKPRFSKRFEWEIIRLTSKSGLSIIGGVSKLFKAFTREYKPLSIVTYADLRFSIGNVYKQIGFKYNYNSDPNYSYTNGKYIISRYKAQKHKLNNLLGEENFDINKTEFENMELNGYSKVFDCGNAVFTK